MLLGYLWVEFVKITDRSFEWAYCLNEFWQIHITFNILLFFDKQNSHHCVVCPSSIYRLWLPLFGIFKVFLLPDILRPSFFGDFCIYTWPKYIYIKMLITLFACKKIPSSSIFVNWQLPVLLFPMTRSDHWLLIYFTMFKSQLHHIGKCQ